MEPPSPERYARVSRAPRAAVFIQRSHSEAPSFSGELFLPQVSQMGFLGPRTSVSLNLGDKYRGWMGYWEAG